jgi:MoxR-like ATPase
LPFAELDRFMVRLRLGYLSAEQERDMVRLRQTDRPVDRLEPVLPCEELVQLQKWVTEVTVTDALVDYAVAIVHRTRGAELLDHGASPRGTLDLVRFAQATALLAGRDYVLPDDIKRAAPPVLAHRVIVKRGTRRGPLDMDEFIDELVESIPVPI